jgi:hypothetical protein
MNSGLDAETLGLTVSAIKQFCEGELPDSRLL